MTEELISFLHTHIGKKSTVTQCLQKRSMGLLRTNAHSLTALNVCKSVKVLECLLILSLNLAMDVNVITHNLYNSFTVSKRSSKAMVCYLYIR